MGARDGYRAMVREARSITRAPLKEALGGTQNRFLAETKGDTRRLHCETEGVSVYRGVFPNC